MLISFRVVLCGTCGWWLHNQKQQDGRNQQLIAALSKLDSKAALVLVNEGADPNTCTEQTSMLTLKARLSHLLRHVSPPRSTSPTAFMIACGAEWFPPNGKAGDAVTIEENLPLIQAMLRHGANVNAREFANSTALLRAAGKGRSRTVALLLEHGADIEAKDDLKQTPLMMAALVESASVAHLLLAHGANPNVQDIQGDNALLIALYNVPMKLNAHNILSELMAYGANPDLKDHDGESPLTLARKIVRPDLVGLLTRGAK